MNKTVLTLSAIWLFDMIKSVMSSTVPEKQTKDIKAELTIKMPLNPGADDWNCVCEAEKRVFCRNVYVVGKPVLLTCGHH